MGAAASTSDLRKKYLAFISIAFIIVAILAGYFYYRYEERIIVHNQRQNLEAIAELKIEQINKWMEEKIQNADNVSKNPYSLHEVEDLINGKGAPNLKEVIINRLMYRIKSFNYENIYLTNSEGKVVLAAKDNDNIIDSAYTRDIQLAREKRVTMFSDFRYCNHHKKIHLLVISPNINKENKLIGFLVFAIDPAEYLFPLMQKWPTESETAETTFYEKDGDYVLIINELRHQPNTALKLRIPLTQKDLPAVKAVNGERGIVDGVDYRGHKVLAYVTQIKGTNWYINSKIDKDEVYAELKYRAYFISIIVILMVLFASTFAAFIYNSRQRFILQSLMEKDKELIKSQELLAVMGSIAKIGGWEFDVKTKKGSWTKEVAHIHEVDASLVTNAEIGLSFYVNESKEIIVNAITDAITKGIPYDLELEMITAKGNHKWVRTLGEPIFKNGSVYKLQGSFQDITDKKKITDTQAFLIECGSKGGSFFMELAEYISKTLNMGYVCIDKLETDGLLASTVAVYNEGMFETNITYALKDTPCGDVVNKSICVFPENVCDLFPNDAALQVLNAESYIGTTLFNSKGKPIGLIAVIDKKPLANPQLAEEILKMVAIRAAGELERNQAEEELRSSEEKYRTLFESNNDGISIFYINNDEKLSKFVEVNDAAAKMLGYTKEEYKNLTVFDLGENINDELLNERRKLLQENKSVYAETRIRHKDGHWVNVEITIILIMYNNRPAIMNIVRDITERKKSIADLKISEEKLRLAMQASKQGWFELNIPTGEIQVSDSYTKILGYEPDEFSSTLNKWLSNIHPEDLDEIQYKFKECIFSGESRSMEYRRKTKSGEWVWLRSVGKVVEYDSKGNPLKMSGTHMDISDRKLAERELRVSEENFANLVESMPEGYYKSLPEGKFVYVNPAFVKMLGYDSKEELMNVNITEALYFSKKDRDVNAPQREEFNPVSEMYRLKKKDGSEIWIEDFCRYRKDEYGNTILHEGVCRDITARKKADEELINAKNRAEELSKIKSNFLANMSHELRTPMVGILGFSEVLQNSLEEEEFRHYAEIIHKGGTRLMDTLNMILNISAIESDNVYLTNEKFNLIYEIKEVVEVFSKTAKQKNLVLSFESDIEKKHIYTDKKILNQVLSNLVNNAVKYTDKGSILVKVSDFEKYNKPFVAIKVIDTGIGIPEDKQELIWEEFRQVSEGISRGFEGTGLGLSITKEFVYKLGGEIYIEKSQPGIGTTFTVLLPAMQNEAVPEISSKETSLVMENTKPEINLPDILYVDDDSMSIDLVKVLVKSICNYDFASSGALAVEKAKSKKYRLILMDINLGKGIDGLITTELIRQIPGYENTPVIAVTALAMKDDREKFLAKGCTHYISKPFLKNEFVSLVTEVLEETNTVK